MSCFARRCARVSVCVYICAYARTLADLNMDEPMQLRFRAERGGCESEQNRFRGKTQAERKKEDEQSARI